MNPQISPIGADSREEATHAVVGAVIEVPFGANLRNLRIESWPSLRKLRVRTIEKRQLISLRQMPGLREFDNVA